MHKQDLISFNNHRKQAISWTSLLQLYSNNYDFIIKYLILTPNIPNSEANVLIFHSLHVETYNKLEKKNHNLHVLIQNSWAYIWKQPLSISNAKAYQW